ncbi:hypothetical protein BY458DRAFT_504583 [Sporodiniella umbellata]|nr:hypothetical protein BY458DRAFT_504583 [Sporodiniella umbellata]
MNNQETFESFNTYDWQNDSQFQSGCESLEGIKDPQKLLEAKHFYFSKFQTAFDLDAYRLYEKKKAEEALFGQVEAYDYSNDAVYRQGLVPVIDRWLAEDVMWDWERLEFELKKTRAVYYHTQIQAFDLLGYFQREVKKKEAKTAACPFANLWQNKGQAPRVDQVNGSQFVMCEEGPEVVRLTLASPTTQNLIQLNRAQALSEAYHGPASTVFLQARVHERQVTATERIRTQDTKQISAGLAYDATWAASQGSQRALYDLDQSYLGLLKPTNGMRVHLLNGQIPQNMASFFLRPDAFRVVTEHALVDWQLCVSHTPMPPLGLISSLRCSIEHKLYLALGSHTLRGPELMTLGWADVFLSETRLADIRAAAELMAVHPDPRAVQLAFRSGHTYAGPDRLSVWKAQVESVFKPDSFPEIQSRLEKVKTAWSSQILAGWKRMPTTLLHVIVRALTMALPDDPQQVFQLETNLNAKWRQTTDYQQWLHQSSYGPLANVDFYFGTLENVPAKESYPPLEIQSPPVVCPITGQVGLVCPSSFHMK